MGVKKRLKLTESQLALLDLLCTRPVWLTALSFAQLLELTVFLLHSNGLVESTQPLGLTVSLLYSNEFFGCSLSPLAYRVFLLSLVAYCVFLLSLMAYCVFLLSLMAYCVLVRSNDLFEFSFSPWAYLRNLRNH